MKVALLFISAWVITYGALHTPSCPTTCVKMQSSVRVCDCVGVTTDRTGITLIDGVVPMFDDTQPNWAAKLYTATTTQDNLLIDFKFPSSFMLRQVDLSLFFCPPQMIPNEGVISISVFQSLLFPRANKGSLLGNISLSVNGQNCVELINKSIATNPSMYNQYLIEFSMATNLGGIYIGELTFLDEVSPSSVSTTTSTTTPVTPTVVTTDTVTSEPPITTTEAVSSEPPITTTEAVSSEPPIITTEAVSSEPPLTTTEAVSSESPITTTEAVSSEPPLTTEETTSENTTPSPAINPTTLQIPTTSQSSENSSSVTTATINTENTTAFASIPLTIVGGLIGVIVFLLVFITIGCVAAGIVVIYRKKKNKKELQHPEGTLLEQEVNKLSMNLRMSRTETTLNSQYETTSFLKTIPNYKFPDSWKNGASADSQVLDPCFNESTQAFFPFAESSSDTNKGNMESDEGIYNEIGDFSSGNQAETSYVSNHIEAMVLFASSSVTQGLDAGDKTDENETFVTNNTVLLLSKPGNNSDENVSNVTTPHGTLTKPEAPRKRLYSIVKRNNPPKVPKKSVELYKALKMETETRSSLERPDGESTNPFYGSKITENNCLYSTVDDASKKPEAKTEQYVAKYNMLMIGDVSTNEIYSEITEKPIPHETSEQACEQVLDSHFEQQNPLYSSQQATAHMSSIPDRDIYTLPDTQDSDDDHDMYDSVREHIEPSMFERAASTKDFKGDDIYAPVYDISTLNSTTPRPILSLKPDNIKKVKTIGTGYFGKVILADTINLSQKELNLGDNEDQKKSSRVAVKQLKSNPSSQAIEAFEKELKFMSRLDHENVIRVLGSCKGATTFIMMEYMENGDLNQYLMNYDNIVVENEEMDDLSVCASTLVRMITQIANGMKYLSSKNFIHRDLATRNCLVGKEMQVKIADFGMSRNLYQSHYYVLKGHAVLPVRWMAKECFYGKFSTKTDVWAFGVTMWEIFTLAKDIPYEDMEDEELVTDATRKDKGRTLLAKPANCPANVYDIMLMCWKQEPKSRASFNTLFETLLPISTQVATSK